MLISTALSLLGAVINAVGIRASAVPKGGRVVSPDPLWRKCRYVRVGESAPETVRGDVPGTRISGFVDPVVDCTTW